MKIRTIFVVLLIACSFFQSRLFAAQPSGRALLIQKSIPLIINLDHLDLILKDQNNNRDHKELRERVLWDVKNWLDMLRSEQVLAKSFEKTLSLLSEIIAEIDKGHDYFGNFELIRYVIESMVKTIKTKKF